MEPASNWQMDLSTIRERAKYAFSHSLFSDVQFAVVDNDGDNVVVSAHKFVLGITSPVFASMFYGTLAETKQPINLTDCTKESFEQLLQFAYTDEVNLTNSQDLIELLYLAEKYMIPSLTEKCRQHFKEKITPQNVFWFLSHVSKLSDSTFEKACWDLIDRETSEVFASSSFCDVSIDVLGQVLCRDRLRVKELALFKAVERWASKSVADQGLVNNGETKRRVLGDDIVKLIRFPLMSQKEFAESVLPTGILQLQEVTELIQHFSKITGMNTQFSKRKRDAQYCLMIPHSRFDGATETVTVHKVTSVLWFTVNKAVCLHGFRVLGEPGCSYDVLIVLYSTNNDNQQKTMIKKWLSPSTFQTREDIIDDSYYGFEARLHKPLPLSTKERYCLVTIVTPGSKATTGRFSLGCNPRDDVYCEELKVRYDSKCYLYKYAQQKESAPVYDKGQVATLIFQNKPKATV